MDTEETNSELEVGKSYHGFRLLTKEALEELDGEALVFLHEESGARLLYLKNDDANKAFSISFKTPPADDTGVFHILEHSVLCGSDKFPVKEPFVNLLKTSMQTFLNAMTFSDKTMYPVASTNEQDLLNLMDVYLDAVLHPAIYKKRAIFEQEGWHLELKDTDQEGDIEAAAGLKTEPEVELEPNPHTEAEEGLSAETKTEDQVKAPEMLFYNGVVYNEMKGALSDASSVLYSELQAALFPDTAYKYESGGKPSAIPQLSYERYLEEHRRHYRLDNSYLTLYGNLNLMRMLRFLDENFLSPVSAEQKAYRAELLKQGKNEEDLVPRSIAMQKPLKSLGIVHPMDTAKENACMGLGFVIGSATERLRILAVDILLDALMGSNEAPLKRALLDAKISGEASAFLAEANLQPFAVIEIKDPSPHASEDFSPLVRKELEKLANGALDHKLIEASLSRYEFILREREFGMADGVAFSVSALASWLYDDEAATTNLRYEESFGELRRALKSDFYEKLIREVFLDNPHQAEVEIRPQRPLGPAEENQRLAEIESELSEQDLSDIKARVALLREIQTTPDSPEALASLPRLSRTDAKEAPTEPPYFLDEDKDFPCIRHEVPTHGIAYLNWYFDLSRLDFSELCYLSILTSVLGKLDTASHTAADLDTIINGKLGNLSFYTQVFEDEKDPLKLSPKLVVSASALSSNLTHLSSLPLEVMTQTLFSDTAKIKDLLTQRRIGMEQSFAQNGHSAALSRVMSYSKPSSVLGEQLSGIEFYRFLKDLLGHFEKRAQDLCKHLEQLSRALFSTQDLVLSFAGSDQDYKLFWEGFAAQNSLSSTSFNQNASLIIPQPEIRNEAFIVPSDVCYTACGFDRRALENRAPYRPCWQTGVRALSFDYLWNEVRVRGGAYGVGFQAQRSGALRFYSYRDPHLDETLQRFDRAPQWLKEHLPEKDVLDGYVVSTIAGIDKPLKARALMHRQDSDYFCGRSQKDRLKARNEVLETQSTDLLDLAEVVEQALAQKAYCVFGNKDILKAAKTPLACIDLLNE